MRKLPAIIPIVTSVSRPITILIAEAMADPKELPIGQVVVVEVRRHSRLSQSQFYLVDFNGP